MESTKMLRRSDKLNIIDHSTFQNIQKDVAQTAPRLPRSAKYKNKHKKQEQQCTLFDFVVKSRQTQKQQKAKKLKRPHLTITKPLYAAKRKGKTRLNPKKKVTGLKKLICSYRRLKKLKMSTVQRPNCEEGLTSKLDCLSLAAAATATQEEQKEEQLAEKIHPIHSRRFRSYCDNCTRPQLKQLTIQLLKDLNRFQQRAYAKNEIKARAHPRFVLGIREASARLRIQKVKLLILATDCEICPGERGLDETIDGLKDLCQQQTVPYCFPLVRRELSYALQKRAQISCVAILDYDGANATFNDLLIELEDARAEYKRLTAV
ncbi:selenocysteine insertion sequence-binding protein 2 [Drosophila subobscura]|uniref:selenocysteine insertion sequence-binding protein 2 n=1 Tax=Drosophila subobscura TaxID=7241 RepID=UPI00155A782D|nr:selenocysteine insertion sequence-binding protein 2 [Drosophila subobscura]